MKRFVVIVSALLAGCAAALVFGSAPNRERSTVPAKKETPREQQTPLLEAAKVFLTTLDAEQRGKVSLPFDSDERLNWHFVPRQREGIPFQGMGQAQRKAALDLLKAGLSAQGYRKVEAIRALEPILRELEKGNPSRDPELFYFTLFGAPAATEPWGCRYEGHHISLNWTVVDGKVIGDSPQFLGANPARVASGALQGTRALEAEEDLARALVKSLDEEQKKEAVLRATAPRDILTGAQRQAAIQDDRGIAHRQLRREQKGMLLALIRVYADAMPRAVAERRLEKIRRAGLDDVKFAWMGGLEPGQGHYYRVQGPTFLIEYDNTQNNANHIHTVWRDFKGDFGADLLAEHYKAHAHERNHGHDPGPGYSRTE
jgi:hypothetical protein